MCAFREDLATVLDDIGLSRVVRVSAVAFGVKSPSWLICKADLGLLAFFTTGKLSLLSCVDPLGRLAVWADGFDRGVSLRSCVPGAQPMVPFTSWVAEFAGCGRSWNEDVCELCRCCSLEFFVFCARFRHQFLQIVAV